jgi:aldose 1-epimerase
VSAAAGSAARAFSGEQIELRHRLQHAIVVEAGAGLRSYTVGMRDVVDGYGPFELPPAAHGQVLMPWPNRLRDGRYEFAGQERQLPLSEPERRNALHGLVRWSNWRIAERDDAHVRFEHVLHAQDGYPFTLTLAVEYTLDEGGLRVRQTAENVGAEPAPFGAGAHPYITAGTPTIDDCTLRAPGRSWLRTDNRAIPVDSEPVDGTEYDFRKARPIGATVLDTAFGELERDENGIARVELTAADGDGDVAVWLDASYRYVMLYTGDSIAQAERRRRALGVEPMTCAPNAFQTGDGLLVLGPGERFSGTWGVTPW